MQGVETEAPCFCPNAWDAGPAPASLLGRLVSQRQPQRGGKRPLPGLAFVPSLPAPFFVPA